MLYHYHRESGGITLMVLVLLVVFGLIMSAALQYVGRQSHDISRRKVVVAARYAAEVGVLRALWLLDPTGGGKTADDVSPANTLPQQNASSTIMNRFFASSGTLNFFEFTGHDATAGILALRSVGMNPIQSDACAIVEADVHALTGGAYSITNWLEQERNCTAGGLGCTSTVGTTQTQPSCPQMERGCAAYPVLTRPTTVPFTRVINSALTSDDCTSFENPHGQVVDVYWVGIEPNAKLNIDVAASDFTPVVAVWGPNGIVACSDTIEPRTYNCPVPANPQPDHYLVVVYAQSASLSQVGEYTLTIDYVRQP